MDSPVSERRCMTFCNRYAVRSSTPKRPCGFYNQSVHSSRLGGNSSIGETREHCASFFIAYYHQRWFGHLAIHNTYLHVNKAYIDTRMSVIPVFFFCLFTRSSSTNCCTSRKTDAHVYAHARIPKMHDADMRRGHYNECVSKERRIKRWVWWVIWLHSDESGFWLTRVSFMKNTESRGDIWLIINM